MSNDKPLDDNDLIRQGMITGDDGPEAGTADTLATQESFGKWADEYLQLAERPNDFRPIETPWSDLNKQLAGGLYPGVYVVVGNTGSGKSQLAVQMAYHALKKRTPVLYLALELDRRGVVARFMSQLGTANDHWSDLYTMGEWDSVASEWMPDIRAARRVKELMEKPEYEHLKELRVACPDPFLFTPQHFKEEIAALRGDNGANPPSSKPILIVLDFLQIMGFDEQNKGADLRNRVTAAAYAGVAEAREQGASLLMLSSTARGNYKKTREAAAYFNTREGEEVEADHLVGLGKESGDIEHSATGVLVLCQESKDDPDAYIAVAKNRTGKTGAVPMQFTGTRWSKRQGRADENRTTFNA